MITGSTTFAELALFLVARGLKLRELRSVDGSFIARLYDPRTKRTFNARSFTVHEAINDALEAWGDRQP